MAIHGASNQGGRSVTVRMNVKTPQKKTSTPIDTTIFCAAASPTTFATRSSVTSNKILFHCFAMYSPGASPLAINCASQALYTWLARSPASIRRCHTHGTRISTEIARAATICRQEFRQFARRLPAVSVGFSVRRRIHLRTPHRAAFYYLLRADDAHILNRGRFPVTSSGGTHHTRSTRRISQNEISMSVTWRLGFPRNPSSGRATADPAALASWD